MSDTQTSDSFGAVAVIQRAELPEGVLEALSALEAVWSERGRFHRWEEGFRLDLLEHRLTFLPSAPSRDPWPLRLLVLAWAGAFVFALYSVWSLRTQPVALGQWLAVGSTLLLSGLALSWWVSRDHRRVISQRRGLCVNRHGLLRIVESGFQFVPREQVSSAHSSEERVYVTLDSGVHWTVWVAPTAPNRRKMLEDWLEGARHFLNDEAPRDPSGTGALGGRLAKLITGPLAVSVFLWLTLVMPTTSEKGDIARAFFTSLRAGAVEEAYGMLTPSAQQTLSLRDFDETLPAQFRSQSAVGINGVSGSVGTVVGAQACVDGWLEQPGGSSRPFRLDLMWHEEQWHIEHYTAQHHCGLH